MKTDSTANRPAYGGWLPLLGGLLWGGSGIAGVVLAYRLGWSAGTMVIVGSLWTLTLLLAAREIVRDLFGPVFVYEVVRVGRRTSTFVFRWIYIGLVVALLALLYYAWWEGATRRGAVRSLRPTELSKFATLFFEVMSVVQYVVIVLLTPAYVAGCITSEKERQTLEFLLATDLRNREIVFGKLAARAITLGMYVLAGLPLLAFLQLFGGIDPDLALASSAGAVLTVFGLSALSLAFSVAAKKSRDAIAVTYLFLIGYLAVSFTLALLVRIQLVPFNYHLTDLGFLVFDWQSVSEWFAAGNPIYVYPTQTQGRQIDGDLIARMLGRYAAFWGSVTGLALLYAVTRLRVVALKQSHGESRAAKSKIPNSRRPVGEWPVLWREVFGSGSRTGVSGWLFRLVILALVATIPIVSVYAHFLGPTPWRRSQAYEARWRNFLFSISLWVRVCTAVMTTIVLFGTALRGAAAVAGERDKDTWISLISSPVTPGEVLYGKWVGCLTSMKFAYVVLVGVWCVGLFLGAVHPGMALVTVGFIAVFVAAFAWVGILCSLWAKTTLGASVRAFGVSLFLAGGFWLLVLVCCALPISISGGGGRSLEIPAILLLGGTPTFVAGWAPMMALDRDGLGPFYPQDYNSGFGPVAPVLGAVFWIGFSLVLASVALGWLTKEMNRDRTTPQTKDPDEELPTGSTTFPN